MKAKCWVYVQGTGWIAFVSRSDLPKYYAIKPGDYVIIDDAERKVVQIEHGNMDEVGLVVARELEKFYYAEIDKDLKAKGKYYFEVLIDPRPKENNDDGDHK